MVRLSCVLVVIGLLAGGRLVMAVPERHRAQHRRRQDLPPGWGRSRKGPVQPKVFVVNMVSGHPFIKTRNAQAPRGALLRPRGAGEVNHIGAGSRHGTKKADRAGLSTVCRGRRALDPEAARRRAWRPPQQQDPRARPLALVPSRALQRGHDHLPNDGGRG